MMCTVCGCGNNETKIEGHELHHDHSHDHSHHHHPDTHHDLHFGHGPAHVHAPGVSQTRMVEIEQNILAKNDAYAATNRDYFATHGIFTLNLVSSPGSGKTSLLVETVKMLAEELTVAVIEGDQQTLNDANRIRATGVPAVQINTGKGCHLDAHMIGHALPSLQLPEGGVLFIENVGNLVCPAGFDLGEAHKVTILSVTEGEDKPLKYPDMFAASDVMILNKCDLLPYLDFDVARCINYARRINPHIEVIQLSARSGQGLGTWLDWVRQGQQQIAAAKLDPILSDTTGEKIVTAS